MQSNLLKKGCGQECHWSGGRLQKFHLHIGIKTKLIHAEAGENMKMSLAAIHC
jgi:hypothetical protein